MLIGERVILAHLPKCGGTSLRRWLEERGRVYRQPGHAAHPKEQGCLLPGVDMHSHLGLRYVLPVDRRYRTCWVTLRDPLDWYPSAYAHLGGSSLRPPRATMSWPDWLDWALTPTREPHHMPRGWCQGREGTVLRELWRIAALDAAGDRLYDGVLWTHQLERKFPGIRRMNVAPVSPTDGQRLSYPTLTPQQRARIMVADGWVRDVFGWGSRW